MDGEGAWKQGQDTCVLDPAVVLRGGGAAGANARKGAKKVVSGGGDVAGSVRDGMEG